jgi:hypothetical protein
MSCRAGGLQPSVEGHEFGGELLCQRQIGGIIAAQAERLGQPEGICMVDLDDLDRHPSVKGDAASNASRCCGLLRSFLRQTLAISKLSRTGATKCPSSSRSATAFASGSSNSNAAKAEASTTLTAIPVGSDDLHRFGGRLKTEPSDFRQDFARGQRSGSRTASSIIASSSPCSDR